MSSLKLWDVACLYRDCILLALPLLIAGRNGFMSSFLNGMEIGMIHVLCRPVFGENNGFVSHNYLLWLSAELTRFMTLDDDRNIR